MSRLDATRAFYGRFARLYDCLATAPGVTAWRRRAAEALELAPGDTVVEMGCGTGANFPHLRERVGPEGAVVGLDVTPGVLVHARERIRRHGWTNVHVCEGDATRPPVDGPVDAVLATFVVGMLDDPAATVADWCALASGGRVALLNFGRSYRLLARPLNPAYEAFVRLSSAGRSREESPAATLERRVHAARVALTARTVARRYEEFAGGYLGLLSGRVLA